ncbi:arylsulfatase [Ruegeria profundi]|uniref:arylsulfatase n=1 Tax=Ruegeria profundi TaxID=1685378 RepID=UPI001CD440DF|nr:arylsulfatase [Ruegeria profundi]MCA0928835.1 arylsulfatase [Ruegeria profundi]
MRYLTLFTLLIGSVLLGLSAANAQGSEQPNVVVMMVDNLGWGELGVYGGGELRGTATPRLDTLAAEGMRLLNFNVEPQCTPSRSAFMTGRRPIRSATTRVVWGVPYGMVNWEVTMAELFSDAGYMTGMFGKWHLGDLPGRFPTDQGFDEWYGVANTTDESEYSSQFQFDASVSGQPMIQEAKRGETPQDVKEYNIASRREIDSELTTRAIDFMERAAAADKPFFAFVPFTQPHLPTLPHPDFDGITGNGHYADVVAEIDFRSGQILDSISELGMEENTIVIWLSDNGPEFFHPWHGTAGPWRGNYFTAWEGSLRVPFLIKWPGRIGAGTTSNEIVHLVDMLPTLGRVAGYEVPDDRIIDGVDQLDFFLGQQANSNREGFIIYNNDDVYGYKWRNWKLHLIELENMNSEPRQLNVPRVFNLITDPKEQYEIQDESTWVLPVIFAKIVEFESTLIEEPPVPFGVPEPYEPPAN